MIIVINDRIGTLSYVAYNMEDYTSTTYYSSIGEALNGSFCFGQSKEDVISEFIERSKGWDVIVYPPDLTFKELLDPYTLTYPEYFI